MSRVSLRAPPWALEPEAVLRDLGSSAGGLTEHEAQERLARFGRNTLPRARIPRAYEIFLLQFKSPLIYVLLAAALVSLLLREWADAGFIFAVLLINAAIGTFQEYSAQRSAEALRSLVTPHARVERSGRTRELDAEDVVPGDVVLLESGAKVPADLRFISTRKLTIDESLLARESLAVVKDARAGWSWRPAATRCSDRSPDRFWQSGRPSRRC